MHKSYTLSYASNSQHHTSQFLHKMDVEISNFWSLFYLIYLLTINPGPISYHIEFLLK